MTEITPDRLDRIEALLEQNTKEVADLRQGVRDLQQELKQEAQRWDERFFQLSRDTLGTARMIIVTAGAVVILSPVLQAFSPAIQTIVARLVGMEGKP